VIKYGKAFSAYGLMPFKLNGETYCFYGGWPENEELEIVGNILENPELVQTQ
jgi:hypothetical protein